MSIMSCSALFVRLTAKRIRETVQRSAKTASSIGTPYLVCTVQLPTFSLLNPQPSARLRQFSTLAVPDAPRATDGIARLVLDRKAPLIAQVQQIVDLPLCELHRQDIYYVIPEVLAKCCNQQTEEGMSMAEDVLMRVIQEKHARSDPDLLPSFLIDKYLYGYSIMVEHNHISLKDYREKVMEVLCLMMAESTNDIEKYNATRCRPSTKTFNSILRGYAKCAGRNTNIAPNEAMSVFQTMQRMYLQNLAASKPNNATYTLLISAFANASAKRKNPFLMKTASQVMVQMKMAYARERKEYEQAFGQPYNIQDQSKNQKEIVVPDLQAYSALIWAYQEYDADTVGVLWREMINNYAIQPDEVIMSTVVGAFGKKARAMKNPKTSHEYAERSEELLWEMVEHARQQNATGRYRPRDHAFNTVLLAWANSHSHQAAFRAEELLQRMLEMSLGGDGMGVKPNRRSFDCVLQAWSRFSHVDPESPRKAEELLDLMYMLSDSQGLDCKPDLASYTEVIFAYSRSQAKDRAIHARRILDVMLQKYQTGELKTKPDVIPFSAVIQAAISQYTNKADVSDTSKAGFTSNAEQAINEPYRIAVGTYSELQHDKYNLGIAPDHYVLSSILQLVDISTAPRSAERRQLVEQVFMSACKAGEVSGQLVHNMRRVCSHDLLDKLFGSSDIALNMTSVDDLPDQSWTRNVKGTRLRQVIFSKQSTRRRNKTTSKSPAVTPL